MDPDPRPCLDRIVIAIPAYEPGPGLVQLAGELSSHGYAAIVIVDDGSFPASAPMFEALARLPGVTVLHHAVNLGKGAALKTAFHETLRHCPGALGVVTADADGQHSPEDIRAIAEALSRAPETLVLGARCFEEMHVPWRSRIGNRITRRVFAWVTGQRLTDTQTGLRGIPFHFLRELISIPSNGYEFEIDMLVAARRLQVPISEQRIRTIYAPGNPTSHFQPLRDSMRIYFVLFRFSLVSLCTAAIDNTIFLLLFPMLRSVGLAQVAGRAAAIVFNYTAVRRSVFLHDGARQSTFPAYLLLVFVSGTLSYSLIQLLHNSLRVPVLWSKLLAETLLFFANFLVQRDFIFTRRGRSGA